MSSKMASTRPKTQFHLWSPFSKHPHTDLENGDRRPSAIFCLRFPNTHTRIWETETEDRRLIFGLRSSFPKHLNLDLENENRRTHLRSSIFGLRFLVFDLRSSISVLSGILYTLGGHHFLWNRGVMNFRKYLGSIFVTPLFDDQKFYDPPDPELQC